MTTALADGREALQAAGVTSIDYLELREADTLAAVGPGALDPGVGARLLAAVHLGRTRLIDNLAVRRLRDSEIEVTTRRAPKAA